jgi:hypothetical protein
MVRMRILGLLVFSLICMSFFSNLYAQGTGGVGGGDGGGVPPNTISVEQILAPTQIVWGKVVVISAVAQGGTAPYSYAMGATCQMSEYGLLPNIAAAPPAGIASWTFNGSVVGAFKAKTIAPDQAGATGSDEDLFSVLRPDKVDLPVGEWIKPFQMTIGDFELSGCSDQNIRKDCQRIVEQFNAIVPEMLTSTKLEDLEGRIKFVRSGLESTVAFVEFRRIDDCYLGEVSEQAIVVLHTDSAQVIQRAKGYFAFF